MTPADPVHAERVTVLFERLRPQLKAIAKQIVRSDEIDDVLQNAFLNLTRRHANKAIPLDKLIKTAVRNASRDILRRKRPNQLQPHQFLGDIPDDATDISHDDDGHMPIERLCDLSSYESEILIARTQDHMPFRVLAQRLHRPVAAVRKAYQRAHEKVHARFVFDHLRSNAYEPMSRYLLTANVAARAAKILEKHPKHIGNLFDAFENRDLNDTVKNGCLILTNLLPRGREETNEAERFLLRALSESHLYRGQKMYIADALLDANYHRHVYAVKRLFLDRMDRMDDRIVPRFLTRQELDAVPLTMFDIKLVKTIGTAVRSSAVASLRQKYLKGVGTLDYRRCLSYQLMRLHPDDEAFMRGMARALQDETDQTNARYVVKYLLTKGASVCPQIIDREMVRITELIAERWRRDRYFAKCPALIKSQL